MDPVTLIVSALVAGATAAAKDTAGQAVKDAYEGLKALLKKRFADKPEAQVALDQHEKQPQVWENPLKDALVSTGADQDDRVLAAAKSLMEAARPAADHGGIYMPGAKGVQVGDHNQQTNTYN